MILHATVCVPAGHPASGEEIRAALEDELRNQAAARGVELAEGRRETVRNRLKSDYVGGPRYLAEMIFTLEAETLG